MKLVQNSGSDRVIDLLLPHLKSGSGLSCVTHSFSLHAFAGLRETLEGLGQVQLVQPACNLDLLGGESDRGAIAGDPVHAVGAGVLPACLAESIAFVEVETLINGIQNLRSL